MADSKCDLRIEKFFIWINRSTKLIFVNFDFKNGCKNEYQDNNEKSCSQFKNRAYESNSTAWELKGRNFSNFGLRRNLKQINTNRIIMS